MLQAQRRAVRLLDPDQPRTAFFSALAAHASSPWHPFGKLSYAARTVPAALPVVEPAAPR